MRRQQRLYRQNPPTGPYFNITGYLVLDIKNFKTSRGSTMTQIITWWVGIGLVVCLAANQIANKISGFDLRHIRSKLRHTDALKNIAHLLHKQRCNSDTTEPTGILINWNLNVWSQVRPPSAFLTQPAQLFKMHRLRNRHFFYLCSGDDLFLPDLPFLSSTVYPRERNNPDHLHQSSPTHSALMAGLQCRFSVNIVGRDNL